MIAPARRKAIVLQGRQQHAEQPLAHDVAVVAAYQPTGGATRQIGEESRGVRRVDVDNVRPGFPDCARETGTDRRSRDRRGRFEAPEGHAVHGFAHLAIAVVDDDDLEIDMAREQPAELVEVGLDASAGWRIVLADLENLQACAPAR